MTPRQVLEKWVSAFNNADVGSITSLYHDDAINHQVANEPVIGKTAISNMFTAEFAAAKMVCIVENIFTDKEWAILEWKDPKGLRGCGFFHVVHDKIILQRVIGINLPFKGYTTLKTEPFVNRPLRLSNVRIFSRAKKKDHML